MHRPGKQDLDCWLQKKERKQAKSVESEGQLLACVPVSCIEKGRSVAMKALYIIGQRPLPIVGESVPFFSIVAGSSRANIIC